MKLAENVNLTIDGVVKFPGGYMHPISFKEMFGEEMYQELLARPRVPSPYASGPERVSDGTLIWTRSQGTGR